MLTRTPAPAPDVVRDRHADWSAFHVRGGSMSNFAACAGLHKRTRGSIRDAHSPRNAGETNKTQELDAHLAPRSLRCCERSQALHGEQRHTAAAMPSGDHLKLAGDKKALKALASSSAGNDTVSSLKDEDREGQPRSAAADHQLCAQPDARQLLRQPRINVRDLHHLSIASQEQEFAAWPVIDYASSRDVGAGVTALQKGSRACAANRSRSRRSARSPSCRCR